MKNLFKLEWRKVFKSKILYIFLAIAAVMPIFKELIVYLAYDLAKTEYAITIAEFAEANGLSGFNSALAAVLSGSLPLCMALFVPIYFCTDYSDRTLRNVIGRGYNRLDVFTVKYLVTMAVAFAYTLVSWIFAFIYGSAFWGAGTFKAKMLLLFFVQTINMLALTSFYILFSVLVKKMGGAICSCIFIPTGIELVLEIADALLVKNKNAKFRPSYIWVDNAFEHLGDVLVNNSTVIIFLIVGFISLALYTVFSVLSVRKTEY